MIWYKRLKAILEGEPEWWLAYLHGQQIENLPVLTRKKPRFRGFILQIAKYFFILLRDLRFTQPVELEKQAKFFVFAGTSNQMSVLDDTIDRLMHGGQGVVAVANRKFLAYGEQKNRYAPFYLSLIDIMRAIALLVRRGPNLYRTLRAKHEISVGWHFATFCSVYSYLAYFYRVMLQVRPEFVITSNDHNVPNRCMLAVAHHLGIKTVYLQHASVSPVFPALRVNYAFLDGQCSLDTYRQCEPNQPNTNRNVPSPKVILSGQKKHIKRSTNRNNTVIGVALNALDNPLAGIQFVKDLVANGLCIRLRWHPGQIDRDTAQYRRVFSANKMVLLSDPRKEPISEFLGQVGWLIAGNSSIHLEAALAGVMPIYYEFTPADHPDYYGYVKYGLTKPAASVFEVVKFVEETQDSHSPNVDAVRYYSSTYLTEWDGKEGELVATCLQRLELGEVLPSGTTYVDEV